MEALSLDHIQVFLTVVEQGSFSAAGRILNRAQSAITYAVQKLEEQAGTPLFDRSAYRPILTEAGRSLLPRMRRIAEEVGAFRAHARGIAGGLEPELTLGVDSLFPIRQLVQALTAFSREFPSVQPRIYVESLNAGMKLVLDRTCAIGLLSSFFSESDALRRIPLLTVKLVPVVSPAHPLAQIEGPIDREIIRSHVQLVLSDGSGISGTRDHGVLSTQTWRLGDLGAKHAMLLAGLGWGNLPLHMIEDDLSQGRLYIIRPSEWECQKEAVEIKMCVAHRIDHPMGPAARWFLNYLTQDAKRPDATGRLQVAEGVD